MRRALIVSVMLAVSGLVCGVFGAGITHRPGPSTGFSFDSPMVPRAK